MLFTKNKRILLVLLVNLFLFGSYSIAQEGLGNALHVDQKLDVLASEVALEKSEIEKHKKYLNKSLSAVENLKTTDNTDKKVILEKLETVKKQEEVVSIKEDLIKKKEDAYTKIVSLIEQKLFVVHDENMKVRALNVEISKSQYDIRGLSLEKKLLSNKISNVNQEIKLHEQNISSKKALLRLKETSSVDESIVSEEERLELSNTEIEQLNKNVDLVDMQTSIIHDYINILKNKRRERIQKHLLVSKHYDFSKRDKVLGVLVLLSFFGVLFVKRKILGGVDQRKIFAYSLKSIANFFLLTTFFSYVSYYCLSYLGFHDLTVFLGVRLLMSVITIYSFLVLHKILNQIIVYLFYSRSKDGEMHFKNDSPLYAIANGASFLAMLVFACLIILNIWGFQHGQWYIFLDIVKFSFYKIGKLELSLLLIIKIALIVWALNVFSHFLNQFLDKNVYPKTRLDESTKYTISVFVKYALVFLGIITGLRILGVELSTLNVLAGTIGIGIGIGLQEIAKNFISGIILLLERPIKVGDYIDLEGLPGRVEAVKARGTVVNTFDNISVVVPNSDFITKQVTNWSYNDKVIRCSISVGVIYGSDVNLVKKCLLEVADKHNKILKKPIPNVYFLEFGDNALQFKLYIWTDDARNRFQLMSDIHFMIDKLFREHNLVIAFPQRDIHLKTSDVVFEVKDKPEQK